MRTLPSAPTGTKTKLALIELGARLRFDVVGTSPAGNASGNSERWVALLPVMPTMLSSTPLTFGSLGTTSGFDGLTPSTPRIGSAMVSWGPSGAAGVRLTLNWPARVSSTRDGVVGIKRAPPPAAAALSGPRGKQPNNATKNWAGPPLPDKPVSPRPPAPG